MTDATPEGHNPPAFSVLPEPETSHRHRLLSAMADAIREQGYDNTTVADVVSRAHTSRRTFYQHFEDRDTCYLALFEFVNERMMLAVAEAVTGDAAWDVRLDRGLATYLELLAVEPELTRSAVRELPVVGAAGWDSHKQMHDVAARLISRLAEEAAEHDSAMRSLSVDEAAFLVGGFNELVVRTVERGGDPRELHPLLLDLISRLTVA